MRRGLFIFMAWICVVGIQAQSDFSFILNKEGKIIGIGAKADILRHDGIFLAQPHRQVSLLGIADL